MEYRRGVRPVFLALRLPSEGEIRTKLEVLLASSGYFQATRTLDLSLDWKVKVMQLELQNMHPSLWLFPPFQIAFAVRV